MNELPTMTQTEAKALVDSIRACFGACLCQQYATAPGLGKVWIDVCEGHQFLNEPHRLARLLWVRRTRDQWRTAEWGGRGALLSHDLGLAQLDQAA